MVKVKYIAEAMRNLEAAEMETGKEEWAGAGAEKMRYGGCSRKRVDI